jgi:WD40 repeat protein
VCNNVYAISGREEIIVGDLRNFSKTVKKFSDGHSDEIQEVKFKDQNILLSSANDGLINTYDLKCQNDDESIMESLNVEQGINKFGFCGANGQYIYTVTQVEEFYVWDIETVSTKLVNLHG